MPNTTTLNETTRSPLDGTEFIRLATTGANWKVQLNQMARRVLTANTNFYVATTGSDSNSGTSLGSAWATLQHAIAYISANYDLAGFTATINVGAGTFAGAGAHSMTGGGIYILGAGSGSTTLTPGPSDGVFNFGECFDINVPSSCIWGISGFTLAPNSVSSGIAIAIYIGYETLVYGDPSETIPPDLVFDCTNVGGADVILTTSASTTQVVTGGSGCGIIGGNGTINSFMNMSFPGAQFVNINVFTLQSNVTVSTAFFIGQQGGAYTGAQFSSGTFSNGGHTCTGQRYLITGGSIAAAGAGNQLGPTHFLGTVAGTCDSGSVYDGFMGAETASGLPTTTQYPDAGTGGLYKDSSGGGVYMVYNDAGTIKKVALT